MTTNMHLIGERYFLYRYRVQCDWALKVILIDERVPYKVHLLLNGCELPSDRL